MKLILGIGNFNLISILAAELLCQVIRSSHIIIHQFRQRSTLFPGWDRYGLWDGGSGDIAAVIDAQRKNYYCRESIGNVMGCAIHNFHFNQCSPTPPLTDDGSRWALNKRRASAYCDFQIFIISCQIGLRVIEMEHFFIKLYCSCVNGLAGSDWRSGGTQN